MRLGTIIQANLAQALQGLAVVPLLAGYDPDTGSRPDLHLRHHRRPAGDPPVPRRRVGLPYAQGALKKLYRDDLSLEDAAEVCVQALYDAADDDSATGGPDRARRIYPSIAAVTADGYRALPREQLAGIVDRVVDARHARPDGPVAPLR